jgi:hypothetical protein
VNLARPTGWINYAYLLQDGSQVVETSSEPSFNAIEKYSQPKFIDLFRKEVIPYFKYHG